MSPPLILASTSKYRAKLLERLALPFSAHAPGVDESLFKSGPARQVARTLAVAKAEALVATYPDAVIIGSDQVCALDDKILDKPGTAENAHAQLSSMSGRSHELITAVAITFRGKTEVHVDETRLTMRRLSLEEIRRYVQHDNPLDCAGSYKVESLGIALFDRIESQDFTAIEGLPLLAVTAMLRRCGLDSLHGELS